jgi:hypothetical protein
MCVWRTATWNNNFSGQIHSPQMMPSGIGVGQIEVSNETCELREVTHTYEPQLFAKRGLLAATENC